jgi:hypothetical protein
MKINATLLVFLFALLLFHCKEVKAQEAGSPSFEAYDKDAHNEREKAIGHSDVVESQKVVGTLGSDSTAIPSRNVFKPSPVIPKSKNKETEGNDDSILSFNFLYYLIQKYKMQDILE